MSTAGEFSNHEVRRNIRCFSPYISKDGAVELRNYKYTGGDRGILYRYFYNPLALKLVHYTPEYIAPNSITLLGFVFTLLPLMSLFVCFGENFEGPISPWWCYFQAFAYITYRILDEMDGK